MSLFQNPEENLTEEKKLKFEEKMSKPEEMSEIIINIFNHEYTKKFPNILLYSKKLFLSQIKKNTLSFLEKVFFKKIKENKEFQGLIENNYKIIEEKYDSDNNILKDIWIKISKNEKENNYLTQYRKHCFLDNDIANHNCQNNSKFILISNNNKIEFVLCNICHKVYKTSLILSKCFHCNLDYYTEIINENKELYLVPATLKKFHCKQLINKEIECIKCKSIFYLNLKTGMLNCINKNCEYVSNPKNILWTCNSCNTNFKSEVIVYNPINEKIIQNTINQALLIKNRAYPNKVPCCDIDIALTDFYHNNNCRGILYLGEINDDSIVICEKCHEANYYENFTWTCPKCQKTFNLEEKEVNKNINKGIIKLNKDIINYIKNDNKKIVKEKSKNDLVEKKEKENNLEIKVEQQIEEEKNLNKKYKSFRFTRSKYQDIKKKELNLLSIEAVKINKNNNISRLKLDEKHYNITIDDENKYKPKRFGKYKSSKFDIKKFKISKNFKKEEESQKENKNLLNKLNNNNIRETENRPQLNLNLEKIEDKQKIIKVRRSVYQYYRNIKSQKNVIKQNHLEPEEKKEEVKNNFKERLTKRMMLHNIDRNVFRRKTVQNPEIKINFNEANKKNEIPKSEHENIKKNEKEKEFVSHLNLDEHKFAENEENEIKEEKEEKENTKGTILEINNNIISTNDTNSSGTKSLKVSKIPGMSDDVYSQIMQQIKTISATCKIPGFNIGDYTIGRKLGEGSYGTIHSLIKEDTQEKFALKKIIVQSIKKVSEIIKEFELINKCHHPNILKIFGLNINLLDHSTYSIQVLIEKAERDWNKDIKRRLQEKKIYTEKELLSIMKQLTLALIYMKEKLNMAHRDIKPQNVLIFSDGVFKLADFGEAKEIQINKCLNTLRGTELYMSPQLYNGLKINKDDIEHDPFKSDLFSLGFCFIYAATMDFNLLYNFRNINDDNEIKKILKENLESKYSEELIWILTKMVELKEKNRFDFNELNSEIDKIIKREEDK